MFCVRVPYTLCTNHHFKPAQSLYMELLLHSVIVATTYVYIRGVLGKTLGKWNYDLVVVTFITHTMRSPRVNYDLVVVTFILAPGYQKQKIITLLLTILLFVVKLRSYITAYRQNAQLATWSVVSAKYVHY